jgi:2-(1,2-epoxy-1,2-dihydrophenyl)acetyl-CoA isomerase
VTSQVRFEQDGAIVYLTMDALPRPSTVDVQLCDGLCDALREIAELPSIRAVVLRGAGTVFSAGGNLEYIEEAMDDPNGLLASLIDRFHDAVLALQSIPQPVIASVHGAAAGAGFSLAVACDAVVAGESARFVIGYPRIGASCDGGLIFHLAHRLGRQRALNAFLSAESLEATAARDLGIVDVLVRDDQLATQTRATAMQFASHPLQAVREVKALLRVATEVDLSTHLQREKAAFLRCAATPTFRERVRQFNARSRERRPN